MQKIIPFNAVTIPPHAERVFKGQIFDVYQWPQELYDGTHATFEMLRRPDTTTVMCLVGDQMIVLDEEQPNAGARQSFPGGRIEPTDESVISSAQREVLEETGYLFEHWRLLKVWQPASKVEWFVYLIVAWGEQGKQQTAHDPGEKIHLTFKDLTELKQLATDPQSYLHEAHELLENIAHFEELKTAPEFVGKTYTVVQ
ncbi:MAG: NUDIX domain-containing protein [Candidatus Saccharimonadales bacterium]